MTKEQRNEYQARFPWVTSFDRDGADLVASVESESVSFERLAEMAEFFGTKSIDIVGATGDHGYCSTCSNPFGYVEIYIRGKA